MLKKGSDFQRILKGISFSWIKFVLSILIGVFQTPLLFKYLPSDQLNTWYIFFSIGAFLQISDLGLVSSISRIIAYLDNSDESTQQDNGVQMFRSFKTKQIYFTALFSFNTLLFVFGFIIYFAYSYFHNDSFSSSTFSIAFVVFILGIICNMLSNIPTAILTGYRDIGYDSIVRSVVQIFYFVSLIVFLPFYHSIIFVSLAFFLQNFIQLVVLHFILYFRHISIFRIKLSVGELIKIQIVKSIYKQSFPLAINQIGTWLTTQGSVFIASIVLGPNQISDYAINQQLFTYGLAISLVLNQSMGPFIAKQYIQKNHENLVNYYVRTTTVCLFVIGIFLVTLLSVFNELISIWVGVQHSLGLNLVVFFALIAFFEVQHSVAGNFVWNMGKWPFNKLTLLAGVLNLSLGYVLGKQYGLLGIAIGTFLSKFFTLNWYVVFYCLKKLGLSVSKYLKEVMLPILFTGIITVMISSYIKGYLHIELVKPIFGIMIISAISVLIFIFIIFIFFRSAYKPLLAYVKVYREKGV
ncbi:polysaccharide biosynthesis protein [Arcticibacter svalbardensis MN12-7]|uniref:Polysaccharide biosynthesis protein n=1 Tax=Arcticibacter svalbardensis MN12-7 TaxID=1150600 RepID=R9GYM3_9SPHI|nr:polysaccharide biosynthesis protein [Arcticibacter svalbardensis]EOR94074.1 polysaccharide biosynthesis protein [Arcticibacter svalbardensis MN12-7]